jgi:hypothetical protein
MGMDSQGTRLATPLSPERQMSLHTQGPGVAPASDLARAKVTGQVAPETIGRAAALLLVLPLMFFSPFICDLLLRLWALLPLLGSKHGQ